MEGQTETEATEEEGLVRAGCGLAAWPLPSCPGRRRGGVTTGERVQGSLVSKPGPGASALQTQTPHVERRARGQQGLCSSPPGEKPLWHPGGRTGCAGRAPQGPLRTQASRASRASPRGRALGGHLPREPLPPEEGGPHTVRAAAAASTQLRSNQTPPGLKGPGRGPAVAAACARP